MNESKNFLLQVLVLQGRTKDYFGHILPHSYFFILKYIAAKGLDVLKVKSLSEGTIHCVRIPVLQATRNSNLECNDHTPFGLQLHKTEASA